MSDLEVYVLIAVLALPAIGVVWIWSKIRALFDKRKNDDYTRRFQERLRSPDFASIEDHFNTSLPATLKDFYGGVLVMEGCDLTINDEDWSIAFFEPLDADSMRESWPGCERFVSIANDGCGNEYVFDPLDKPHPILFHDHETGELDVVTHSLDEFMGLVQRAIIKSKSEQDACGNRR
ncbi:SMI1/KNR4 family protein [Phragmitibacter flavus]|uniref:SMI1/KNR4 family protein n=1 Tax=Phragmitibacter flavus TaxID=2576071 RepID=A0A5R8KEW8_9BACT|nr:SMI1/KNR4 family protein [Phragmitibacter flavus]TLD70535.1 SMI1/KNR4 family protein [Phragmitibacter flavus]